MRVNGLQQASVALKGTTATYTFTPQAGSYSVSGQYSGDTNYASSSASLTVTVVPAPTTTKIAYSGAQLSTTGSQVANYVLTAAVTSTVPVIGVVNFYSGTTLLGSSGINNKGVATLILYNTNPIPGIPPFVASQSTARALCCRTRPLHRPIQVAPTSHHPPQTPCRSAAIWGWPCCPPASPLRRVLSPTRSSS